MHHSNQYCFANCRHCLEMADGISGGPKLELWWNETEVTNQWPRRTKWSHSTCNVLKRRVFFLSYTCWRTVEEGRNCCPLHKHLSFFFFFSPKYELIDACCPPPHKSLLALVVCWENYWTDKLSINYFINY